MEIRKCISFRANHFQSLNHQTLNLVLDSKDLRLEVTSIVGGDADSDHGARDTSGSAKGKFAGNVAVGNVLILAVQFS